MEIGSGWFRINGDLSPLQKALTQAKAQLDAIGKGSGAIPVHTEGHEEAGEHLEEAKEHVEGLEEAWKKFKESISIAGILEGIGLGGFYELLKGGLETFMEVEDHTQRMRNQMEGLGMDVAETSEKFEKFEEMLLKSTVMSRGEVRETLSHALNLLGAREDIEEVIVAAKALSASYGGALSMQRALRIVGGATGEGGNVANLRQLARFDPAFRTAKSPQEMEALFNKRVASGGEMEQKEGQTFGGSSKKLSQEMGGLWEAFSKGFEPVAEIFRTVTQFFTKTLAPVRVFLETHKDLAKAIAIGSSALLAFAVAGAVVASWSLIAAAGTMVWAAATAILTGAIAVLLSPITLVVVGLALIGAAFIDATQEGQTFGEKTKHAFEKMGDNLSDAGTNFKGALTWLWELPQRIVEGLELLGARFRAFFTWLIDSAIEAGKAVGTLGASGDQAKVDREYEAKKDDINRRSAELDKKTALSSTQTWAQIAKEKKEAEGEEGKEGGKKLAFGNQGKLAIEDVSAIWNSLQASVATGTPIDKEHLDEAKEQTKLLRKIADKDDEKGPVEFGELPDYAPGANDF